MPLKTKLLTLARVNDNLCAYANIHRKGSGAYHCALQRCRSQCPMPSLRNRRFWGYARSCIATASRHIPKNIFKCYWRQRIALCCTTLQKVRQYFSLKFSASWRVGRSNQLPYKRGMVGIWQRLKWRSLQNPQSLPTLAEGEKCLL